MTMSVKLVGLCRWSYPAEPGAFSRSEGLTLEQQRRKLYDPQRLAKRLLFLREIIVPCLKAQTDQDFTLLLLMGDQLPEATRAEVLEIISEVPQIKPIFREEGLPHQKVCCEAMKAERDMDVRAMAEFRLDDDDAVAVDFVERTRDFFPKMRGIYRNGGKLVLDFNRGFILNMDEDGVELKQVITRNWTPGQVLFIRPQSPQCLFNFAHIHMWRRMPTMNFPRTIMFLRGAHAENDSQIAERQVNEELLRVTPGQVPAMLKERFNLDLHRLRARWSRLSDLD